MFKTFITTPKIIHRNWHLIDLDDQILGRVSTQISQLLIGKNKPFFTQAMDCGDYVVVINANKVKLTGNKENQKMYRWHTGYPGGFREKPYKKILEKDPRRIIESAVSGMLPKNKLRTPRLRRLKVFTGPEHQYQDKFQTKNSPK